MFLYLIILTITLIIIEGRHFDGGTINWAPINPYDNSSSVAITITQSYYWAYPTITCANNVPITTSGRSTQNWNLTCVVDCSTDGGYSTKPINMLTDCTSANSAVGIMTSSRSHNLTLTAGSYFYLANVGSAWVALNYPAESGLQWSIVTFIDLRLRPDGFIDTPPVASVVSPQYAIVNRTMQINIPVSDVNAGDDVRCRWSTYTPGFRRRRRSNNEERTTQPSAIQFYKKVAEDGESIHIRKKRGCGTCNSYCVLSCGCSCNDCDSNLCTGSTCTISSGCSKTGISSTSTISSTTASTTTVDTPGTLKSTSSYPSQQAIDECGGICYPGSVPNGTSLSNCTITFTGTRVGVWYAVAIQVEDFINDTSTTPMSSVPVQLLIYVLPTPFCNNSPIILPVNGCLEVQCYLSSSGVNGMIDGNLTSSPTNSSLSYLPFTWTPQTNQIGSQQLCVIAYTTEQVQSTQYCVTFIVKATSDLCVTTTTTTTTTTSKTTTTTSRTTTTTTSTTASATTTTQTDTTITTSRTTTTTTSTTTSETTMTTTDTTTTTASTITSETTTTTTDTTTTSSTSTSTTSSTSSTTTSSTSTSSTSISTTSASTSITTSSTSTLSTTSTSTTSSTTSTTTTSTSTTTTSTTSTTSTTTTTTSVTTTTVTTATTTTTTTTKASKNFTNWLLILGLSLLALLLAICCACCCLYCFLWGPAARRRRRRKEEEKDDVGEKTFLSRNIGDLTRKQRAIDRMYQPMTSSMVHMLDKTSHAEDSMISNSPTDLHLRLSDSGTVMTNVEESRVSSTVAIKKLKQSDIRNMNNIQKVKEPKKVDIKLANEGDSTVNNSGSQHPIINVVRVKRVSNIDGINTTNLNTTQQETLNVTSTTTKRISQVNVTKLPRSKSSGTERPRGPSISNVIHVPKSSIEMQSTATQRPPGPSIISVIHVPKSSIEMQSTATQRPRGPSIISVIHVPKSSIEMQSTVNRSKSLMPTIDAKAKTNSGVTVIKLPRNLSSSKSDDI